MTLPAPYYDEDGITIYHGDCRDILPDLEPVDLVLTDPPYMVGLNYEGDFDDKWDAEVFSAWHVVAMAATAGPVVWFGASPRLQRDLEHFCEPPQRIVIWSPRFSLSRTGSHGMMFRWHPVYCWRLPKKHDGPKWDIVQHPCDGHNAWNHPGTKPLPLIQCLIGIVPGGTILDLFMGSGTTLVAAKLDNRKAIGIEIEERYCEIAANRLRQGVFDFGSEK